MTVHPAALAFDHVATEYESGRPEYPAAAVAWLADRLDIHGGATVVDLAAGTGKLTRALVPLGACITAVEPVAGMRAALEASVAGMSPPVQVMDGTAESMPLADGSVHAVVVGQAFHWFDADRALAEIHRVLEPGGALGLVWNVRDLSQPLQESFHRIVNRHRGSTPAAASGRWRQAFESSDLFGPVEEAEFAFEQVLDAEGLVARGVSISFIAALPEGDRARVASELRALAGDGEPVSLRYRSRCYACRAL